MHAEWWGAYVWSECLWRVIREGGLQGWGGLCWSECWGACLGQPSEEGFWAGLGRGGGGGVIVSGVTHMRPFLAPFTSVPGVPYPPSQAQYSVLIGIRARVRGRRRRRITELVLTIRVL